MPPACQPLCLLSSDIGHSCQAMHLAGLGHATQGWGALNPDTLELAPWTHLTTALATSRARIRKKSA